MLLSTPSSILLLFSITLLTLPSNSQPSSHVVISEARINGTGSAENDEFIEIYNPTGVTVDLTGWTITSQNATGGNQLTINLHSSLPPHKYLLVGDAGMNPAPDVALTSFSLTNPGGSIILKDNSQHVVDALGWGNPQVYEGTPVSNSGADGNSLERKASANSTAQTLARGGSEEFAGNGYDSDNNANDFVVQTQPSPQNLASPPEPQPANSGAGIATITPESIGFGQTDTFRIVCWSDTTIIQRVWIVVPSVFNWSKTTADLHVTHPQGAFVTISGDTVKIDSLSIAPADSLIVEIFNLTPADTTDQFIFFVLTSSGVSAPAQIKVNPSVLVHGTPRTIAWVRRNDTNGVPMLNDRLVTIRGVVTVSKQFGGPAYLQDSTAGIAVYDSLFENSVHLGDDVTLTGKVTQYNGLTELKNAVLLSVNEEGVDVTPGVATLKDIASDGTGGIEKYEGLLVRVDSVTTNTSAWTVSGSGTNYMLYDVHGDSLSIRIDDDVDFANTSAPSGIFDVVGIISQFVKTPPYIGGYQLMPRSHADIITPNAGPGIVVNPPYETHIDSVSITLSWRTLEPATTILKYGRTTQYELGEKNDTTKGLIHTVTLENLSPATAYHVLMSSSNDRGTSSLPDYVTSSASAGSTGKIEVYFNHSVDTSLARWENSQGPAPFLPKLLERIATARYSIDACLYSLSGYVGDQVAQALISARNRGVRVRVIAESDNLYPSSSFAALQNAGIPVIGDNADSRNADPGLMHNKFFIFDYRDTTSAADDWVLTGSWNPTEQGTYNDYQNMLLVQDKALAGAYTLEFNEMWGSDSDTPDTSKTRFGIDKNDDTPHVFSINGMHVELYFSPSDHPARQILKRIDASTYAIDLALLTFTRYDLSSAIVQRIHAGVHARGVFDNNTDANSQYPYLVQNGADIRIDQSQYLFHHKYAIFDAEHYPSDAWVVTGSYNWTNSAENRNDENVLLIQDHRIANFYLQEFAKRYSENGGRDTIIITRVKDEPLAHSYILFQNYPNPFNTATTIRYALPVEGNVRLLIYDVLGRLVRELVTKFQPAGVYTVSFDADKLPSGVYYYRLETPVGTQAKAMLLLK